ncbi:MAG: NAD-dependent epimerase/dehydratase family protein [Actinobacteria bacterium]|nr:NAD-dependent epimerase/dehydratase family protein [Actinomycetota bacterium]
MRVLVTGGSSLLARRTAEALLARGDEVVMLQRGEAPIDAPQVRGDVRDADLVHRALDGCDAVVHAAAKVGIVGSWEEFRSINVDGTANVIAAARELGLSRVVYVSTPSVSHAGHSLVGALADPPVTGRTDAHYAESKAVAERLALGAASDALPVVAIRPHLVWGPGDTQLVGRIVERARAGRLALVGGGTALIDTTYIDNAASALVAALDAAIPGATCVGRAYVIANGEPRPIRELIEGILHAAGVTAEPKVVPLRVALGAGSVVEKIWARAKPDEEPPLTRFLAEQLGTAHWFDPRPARDDLGWRPTVTIDQGLAELAAWFATH